MRRAPFLSLIFSLGSLLALWLAWPVLSGLHLIPLRAPRIRFHVDHEELLIPRVDQAERYQKLRGLSGMMRLELDGREIFSSPYHLNQSGLRVTSGDSGARESHLFFGGSDVFGYGTGDEGTIPSRYCQRRRNLNCLNYGALGAGPHNTLHELEQGVLPLPAPGGKVAVHYFVIPDSIRRVVGSSALSPLWNQPAFHLEEGSLVHGGDIWSSSPIRYGALRLGFQIAPEFVYGLMRFSGFFHSIRDEDFRLFARILARIRDELLRKLPGSEFELVILQRWEPVQETRWLRFLQGENLEVVQLASLRYKTRGADQHPSPEGYQEITDVLLALHRAPETLNAAKKPAGK